MVVRELIALMGVKTDDKSFKKAEKKLGGIAALAKKAVLAFGAFQGIRLLQSFIKDASAVNETLNVLDASFKENQQTVIDWASSFADAAGRSQFEMRETASTLGAVLTPMMEGNAKASSEMSMRLSELTVDLASFFNAAENDVLVALRSGITGEAEPLKRFGIIMNQATLEAFALSEGLNKSFKSLSNAEKTTLRYNFILQQTANAHGDAIKTGGGFANVSKALAAKLKDAGIRIGLFMLPVLEKMIPLIMDIIDSSGGFIDVFGKITQTALKFLKVGLQVIRWLFKFFSGLDPAVKGLIVFVAALSQWQKIVKLLLSPLGKLLMGIGFLILLFDDLNTFLEGGDSLFGRLVKTVEEWLGLPIEEEVRNIIGWFGKLVDDQDGAVNDLVDGVEEFGEAIRYFFTEFIPDKVGEGLTAAFGENAKAVLDMFVSDLKTLFQTIWDVISWPFKEIAILIGEVFEFGIPTMFANLKTDIEHWMDGIRESVFGFIDTIKNKFKSFFEGGVFSSAKNLFSGTFGGGVARSAAGGARGGINNALNNKIDVVVNAAPGMNENQLAAATASKLNSVTTKQNRDAMRVFSPRVSAGVI